MPITCKFSDQNLIIKFKRLDLTDNIHDGTVTAFNDTDNTISKLYLLWFPRDRVSDIT